MRKETCKKYQPEFVFHIDARPLVRLCLDMNWTHASS